MSQPLSKTQKRRQRLLASKTSVADENEFIQSMILDAQAQAAALNTSSNGLNNSSHNANQPLFTKADESLLSKIEHDRQLNMQTNAPADTQTNAPADIQTNAQTGALSSAATTSTASTTVPTNNTTASAAAAGATHELLPPTVLVTEEDIINKANFMWKEVKDVVKKDATFKTLEDKKKIDFFRKNMGYASFMDDHPIITRYMICMGQYKTSAFKRYLDKVKKTVHPPVDKREKGYMEDQWIRRQADYVQYLWESYQRGHYNNAEKKWVWQNAYQNLRGEFDDFRDMHKDIEARVEEEKSVLAAQNARELLERLKTGSQQLSAEEELVLLRELQNIIIKRKYATTLEELVAKVKLVPSCSSGTGQGPEHEAPKITMIETVDPERMHEIDDKYKEEKYRGVRLDVNGNPMQHLESVSEETVLEEPVS